MGRNELAGRLTLRPVSHSCLLPTFGIVNADPGAEAGGLGIGSDGRAQFADVYQASLLVDVQPAGPGHVVPLPQKASIRIEHLHAVVLSIGQVHQPVPVGSDVVGDVELARAVAGLTPGEDQPSVRAVLVDAGVAITIRHVEIAVAGINRNMGAAVERIARHEFRGMSAGAQGQQYLAFQGALAYGVVAVVGQEYRPVGRHGDPVRAGEHPLAPGLDEVAILVEHDHRVLAPIERVHVVVSVAAHGSHLSERIAVR